MMQSIPLVKLDTSMYILYLSVIKIKTEKMIMIL